MDETHHRRHTLECPHCRALTTAAPVPEAAGGFGPKLAAATAYLTGVGRLGKRAVRAFFADSATSRWPSAASANTRRR